jgi:hypothetical protein
MQPGKVACPHWEMRMQAGVEEEEEEERVGRGSESGMRGPATLTL